MEPISNADRLLILLRQRLQERAKAASGARERQSAPGDASSRGLDAVRALAATDGVEDQQLKRALIQSILSDQFGAQLLNEARFQQVVDRVTEALVADGGTSRLLADLVAELRHR